MIPREMWKDRRAEQNPGVGEFCHLGGWRRSQQRKIEK